MNERKTTNFLLGIIAALLAVIALKGSGSPIVPDANAQVSGPSVLYACRLGDLGCERVPLVADEYGHLIVHEGPSTHLRSQ